MPQGRLGIGASDLRRSINIGTYWHYFRALRGTRAKDSSKKRLKISFMDIYGTADIALCNWKILFQE